MQYIPESELILNPDGSVYHLNLRPEQVAPIVIVVGDPGRVAKISQYFDSIEYQVSKREFVTHTGRVGSTRLSVISSGIGPDNVDILLNELDALFNVDLLERKEKQNKTQLNIIRVGTSGSLQADIPVDSLLVSETAIGLDNLHHFYRIPQDEISHRITQELSFRLDLATKPYLTIGSRRLLEQFAYDMYLGNTLTAPGFYAPQGRAIRLKPVINKFTERVQQFAFNNFRLTNMEMETSTYYGLCKLLGHEMISLNAILANRPRGTFSQNPAQVVDKLIRTVLERL